jgi:hypothetical protein
MFENLYKSVDSKVQPSLKLINETKQMMKSENKVVRVNFYKYGALAACLVIFIGVLSVNTQKNITMDEASSMIESPSINETSNDSYKETPNISAGGNPFSSAFDSATTSGTASSVATSKNSILSNIAEFFIAIAQWFKELLF